MFVALLFMRGLTEHQHFGKRVHSLCLSVRSSRFMSSFSSCVHSVHEFIQFMFSLFVLTCFVKAFAFCEFFLLPVCIACLLVFILVYSYPIANHTVLVSLFSPVLLWVFTDFCGLLARLLFILVCCLRILLLNYCRSDCSCLLLFPCTCRLFLELFQAAYIFYKKNLCLGPLGSLLNTDMTRWKLI